MELRAGCSGDEASFLLRDEAAFGFRSLDAMIGHGIPARPGRRADVGNAAGSSAGEVQDAPSPTVSVSGARLFSWMLLKMESFPKFGRRD